jgi:molybdopterin molybdotransferase
LLLKVKDVSEVQNTIMEHFGGFVVESEEVGLLEAPGRVAAEDIKAVYSVPDFNKSVVDGYAVRARDTFGASDSLPALLDMAGEVMIGSNADININVGSCAYVPTGGMLPEGSDAVVMVEDTEDLGSGSIAVYKPIGPWENTISRGEDIKAGGVVLEKGTVIRPQHVGVLASVGLERVPVFKRPRVSIISTGDELIPPGEDLQPGKIWDINSYSLAAAAAEDGAFPILGGIVPDDRATIKTKVMDALTKSDALLISGGSSAGARDYTAEIINELGRPGVLAHGISIKPGKPTIIGGVDGKPVIGMPGQPVSSLVVYNVVVSPLIRRMAGQADRPKSEYTAVCDENYYSAPGREEYLMVTVYRGSDGKMRVRPVSGKSGMITTISNANGMVVIPKNKEGLYRDEEVRVIML